MSNFPGLATLWWGPGHSGNWQGGQSGRTAVCIVLRGKQTLPPQAVFGPGRREPSWVCDCLLTASCNPLWSSCSQRRKGGEGQWELLSPDWPVLERQGSFRLCTHAGPLLLPHLPPWPSRHMAGGQVGAGARFPLCSKPCQIPWTCAPP